MQSSPVYLGIDVACAAGKRLPICVVSAGPSYTPLIIPKSLAGLVPRGLGNKEIVADKPFREIASVIASALKRIMSEMGWGIERIAIDAPAAAPARGSRASEDELGRCSLSYFRTPSAFAWAEIRKACANHMRKGGSTPTLPHANKIWMLFGFELFSCLRRDLRVEVIEVYPFAIVRALLPACGHKSTEKGYCDQLRAVADRVGWKSENLEARLKLTVPGSRHDRLDAFMAAWVASLPPGQRRAFGNAECVDDAIWVPL